MSILQNAARCKKCDTIVQSLSRHNYAVCTCGAIAVDGGRDYIQTTGEPGDIENLALFDQSSPEEIHTKLLWGTRGIKGDQPLTWKYVSGLETSHLEAILRTQTNIAKYIADAIRKELRIRRIESID